MNSRDVSGWSQLGRKAGRTEQTWCRSTQAGTGVIVVGFLFNRPISFSLLQSAIDKLHANHPILRTLLTTTTTKASRVPFFSVAVSPSITLRSVAAADVLPAASSLSTREHPLSSFHSILEHELNQNPWSKPADSMPVFFPTAYELSEPDRGLVLAIRLHTAVCDWASVGVILRELWGLIGRPETAEAAKLVGGGKVILPAAIEDLMDRAEGKKSLWSYGKDLVRYSLNGLRMSTIRFNDVRGSNRSSAMARLALSVEETQKLLKVCKSRGIKLCGALTAAAMLAAHSSKYNVDEEDEEAPLKYYGVVTLVDCRKHLESSINDHQTTIGLYYSAIINTHDIHGGEGLWDLAVRCYDSFSSAKNKKKQLRDLEELSFIMCKAIDNPMLTPSAAQRTGLVSVFEDPMVYRSSEWNSEMGLEDFVGCASVHGVGPSIAVYDTIRDDQLDCTCTYPTPLHSREQINELLEHMKRLLTE